jgi:hypothetical protein
VGLLGAYSNPEIQGRLRQLSEKLDQLAASDAVPQPSGRADRKLRNGMVPKAIEAVLAEAPGPMRVHDIHAEVEDRLGMTGSSPEARRGVQRRNLDSFLENLMEPVARKARQRAVEAIRGAA